MIEKFNKEYDATYYVVAAIITNNKGELLLIRRSGKGSYVDHWQIPEGKVEMGEKPSLALAREVKEETGLITTSSKPALHQEVEFNHPKVGNILFHRFIFRAEVEPGEISLSSEHSEYTWVDPHKALEEELFVPGLEEILNQLVNS